MQFLNLILDDWNQWTNRCSGRSGRSWCSGLSTGSLWSFSSSKTSWASFSLTGKQFIKSSTINYNFLCFNCRLAWWQKHCMSQFKWYRFQFYRLRYKWKDFAATVLYNNMLPDRIKSNRCYFIFIVIHFVLEAIFHGQVICTNLGSWGSWEARSSCRTNWALWEEENSSFLKKRSQMNCKREGDTYRWTSRTRQAVVSTGTLKSAKKGCVTMINFLTE